MLVHSSRIDRDAGYPIKQVSKQASKRNSMITHACRLTTREDSSRTYISGSFCVSITAATGIPKLETGPQKSICSGPLAIHIFAIFLVFLFRRLLPHGPLYLPCPCRYDDGCICLPAFLSCLCRSRLYLRRFHGKRIGGPETHTGREDIVQNLVGTDLCIESLDCGSHCDEGESAAGGEGRETGVKGTVADKKVCSFGVTGAGVTCALLVRSRASTKSGCDTGDYVR